MRADSAKASRDGERLGVRCAPWGAGAKALEAKPKCTHLSLLKAGESSHDHVTGLAPCPRGESECGVGAVHHMQISGAVTTVVVPPPKGEGGARRGPRGERERDCHVTDVLTN